MGVVVQITFGSFLLILCLLLHIGVQVLLVRKLRSFRRVLATASGRTIFFTCSAVVFVLLTSHTIHVYLWAIALWLIGALPGYEEPIYFSLVTYTTVGYGDVTLAPAHRIFGGMASVSGILAFGLTTAFLVALFPRIIQVLRDEPGAPFE